MSQASGNDLVTGSLGEEPVGLNGPEAQEAGPLAFYTKLESRSQEPPNLIQLPETHRLKALLADAPGG